MNLVDRVKGILTEPRSEWVKIAAEPSTVQSLYTGWIMILAAIGPIALLISMHSIQIAIAQYVLSLILTFVLALIVDALAPSFGGTKDFIASLKLTAYSYTVAWLAGIFYAARNSGRIRLAAGHDLRALHVLPRRAGAQEVIAGKSGALHRRDRAVRDRAGRARQLRVQRHDHDATSQHRRRHVIRVYPCDVSGFVYESGISGCAQPYSRSRRVCGRVCR